MHCYSVFQHFLNAVNWRKSFYTTIFIVLCGCVSSQPYHAKAPGWYLVKPTDTLYSISWRYGLDYNDLARWNGIDENYIIHPGQQLILIEPDKIPEKQVTASVDNESSESETKNTAVAIPLPDPEAIPRNPDLVDNKVKEWRWPTEGKVKSLFSLKDLDRRGIDIAGKIGQPVYAVAAGKVVYSGTGLAGYGNLIIIKHNDMFLSAYAYNRNRLVSEGAQVKQGTLIAEMGQDKEKKPVLHFQIRKKGKPVDPLRYLPKL